ncbi:MAG: triose-phosphate isomerase [Saprospiraceae bacterium]|nr:triose-phosphate isomerase [Saprospiraceae bacterium]MBK9728208.1 triose-phosphate isomerase [Saprospiraceae bacterium]
MNHFLRKSLVAANWKMNILPTEANALVRQLIDVEWTSRLDVLICPPYTHLPYLIDLTKEGILIGAQNCHINSFGAYTGEVSAEMLVDIACSHVILGHSERRAADFNENMVVSRKIQHAINAGLEVVYCCGETLEVRESGSENQFVANQLLLDLKGLEAEMLAQLIIAYEPIWAIGTGINATAQQAQAMHLWIREQIRHLFNEQCANNIRIIYGGSVKASNSESLSLMPDIDGVLVGGASLIPKEFQEIIKYFS